MGSSCCAKLQSEKEIQQVIKSSYNPSLTSIKSRVFFSKPLQEVQYVSHVLLNIDEEPIEEIKEDYKSQRLSPGANNLNKKFLLMLK
ncbi:unnamed protein product (macronuclear) [Paramecium tetraurelia]|uniref:Uncharacterized protein n=1 Tax=Paramecium tetraurelia TaxID=5888 RepID=A0EIL4_PARTE|nr:uncharacterized protein GSPATT00027484001 [Paramecium tetraurelia]CAK95155.1 unnamed protein product [Paramecium tetraurelia]|eukprot:XP_001462528.1 hypothetical protein (macronuclear) [Paramecium tetraurelia strain d4-2]